MSVHVFLLSVISFRLIAAISVLSRIREFHVVRIITVTPTISALISWFQLQTEGAESIAQPICIDRNGGRQRTAFVFDEISFFILRRSQLTISWNYHWKTASTRY